MILLLCLHSVMSAPLHMQFVPMHMPYAMRMPAENLQHMLEVQRLQMNPYYLPNQPQPLVIILPNDETNKHAELKSQSDHGKIDEELNSVVLDAADEKPHKALVLLPNGRFSIGDFISSIPWLPVEINVPDTISWAYNGISDGIAGIISIIGQRLPFQRPPQDTNLRSVLSQLQLRKNIKPVIILPFDSQVMHLPIEV